MRPFYFSAGGCAWQNARLQLALLPPLSCASKHTCRSCVCLAAGAALFAPGDNAPGIASWDDVQGERIVTRQGMRACVHAGAR